MQPFILSMKTSSNFKGILLAGASLIILGLMLASAGDSPKQEAAIIPAAIVKSGQPLKAQEWLTLESIAKRAESMMAVATFVSTRVWPHGVRDNKGRLGIFIGCNRPLFAEKDERIVKPNEAWVVFGLIAAVKYSEGSQVGHIAFTDRDGIHGERWYYDLDMPTAREIHSMMFQGLVAPENAYHLIESSWVKVTAEHDYAVN